MPERRDSAVIAAPLISRAGLIRAAEAALTLPLWVQALCVYVLSRMYSLGVMAVVVRKQPESPWTTGTTTSLNDFLNFWDARWYERVAEEWYPNPLPLTESGDVAQNQWAFYPLHPLIVRDLSMLTGIDYQVLSPIVSMIAAGAASVVILAIFRRFASPGKALTGLAFVLFFPPAAVLSTGYAEALTLLLHSLALLLVIDRRYLWAMPVVLLMDLSRPIGVAFSFFMLLHLIDRFVRRGTDPYPMREVVSSWGLGVFSCAAALVHLVHAWIVTGDMRAYLDTEASWHAGQSIYFTQWLRAAENYIGPLGWLVLAAGIAAVALWLYSPAATSMGRVPQQFCTAYIVYLLLFFTPQTSTLRMLLPLFPMAMLLAHSRSWSMRAVVLASFAILQIFWVGWLWHFTPPADLPP